MHGGSSHRRRSVLAHHLILTGYGHWHANDLRGSGSTSLRDPRFAELGDIHPGRKPDAQQPSKSELKAFMRQGTQLLTHDVVWFDEPMRTVIADAFGRVIREHGYTCWACAVCSNHAHLVVRVHRDRYQVMWEHLTEASRASLVALNLVPDGHPAWSQRPYSRFCYTPTDVRSRVGYVEGNPEKEGLPRQLWDFVTPYDGWGPGSVAG